MAKGWRLCLEQRTDGIDSRQRQRVGGTLIDFSCGFLREEPIDFPKTLVEDHRASPRMHNARQIRSFPREYALPRSGGKITHCFPYTPLSRLMSRSPIPRVSRNRSPRSALYVTQTRANQTLSFARRRKHAPPPRMERVKRIGCIELTAFVASVSN